MRFPVTVQVLVKGRPVRDARIYLYEKDGKTIHPIYTQEEGGTPVDFVVTKRKGDATVWVDTPGIYIIRPKKTDYNFIDEFVEVGVGDGSTSPNLTAPEIKTLYESNPDTNAYTDAEKIKLAGLSNGSGEPPTITTTDLFALQKPTDFIDTTGLKEVTAVIAVGDVAGNLAGKYFRIHGSYLSGNDINYARGFNSYDIWYEVDGVGTQPSSGANGYLKVTITQNASATDVAAATVAVVDAFPAFSAHIDPNDPTKFYIINKLAGDATDSTAETSGFTVTKVQDGTPANKADLMHTAIATLAPNGFIYIGPADAYTVLKLNPDTGEITTIPSPIHYQVMLVAAQNGFLYGIPGGSTSVLKFDPKTDTAMSFGSFPGGNGKWRCGALAENGAIYCPPYRQTTILKIDTKTDTTSYIGNFSSAMDKWAGAVLAPNGFIYFIPYNASTILKLDPRTDTYTEIGNYSGTRKWLGGVLANGNIYGIPYNSGSILKIDPTTDTITTFGSFGGSSQWAGGCVVDGQIYCAPYNASTILKIDSFTDTVTTFGSISGYSKYNGAALARNGVIYCTPWDAQYMLEIHTGKTPTPFELSAYYNKY